MRSNKIALSALFLILVLPGLARAQTWHGIEPLKSTRADVERLLGPNNTSYGVTYELPDEVVSIVYSSGPCTKERAFGWNAPKDTVISFTVSPRVKTRLSDFKVNLKKFKKENYPVQGTFYYINKAEGISFDVENGLVTTIYYDPPARYNHLYCGDAPGSKDY